METLYYARMKRNISEKEMAKAAGIPTATYRRYETRPYHFTFRQCMNGRCLEVVRGDMGIQPGWEVGDSEQ